MGSTAMVGPSCTHCLKPRSWPSVVLACGLGAHLSSFEALLYLLLVVCPQVNELLNLNFSIKRDIRLQ